MKRKYLGLLLAAGMVFTSVTPSFAAIKESAAAIEEDDKKEAVTPREGTTLLTLEEATKEAIRHSSDIKTANRDITNSEKNIEEYGEIAVYSSGDNLSSILNLIEEKVAYADTLLSKDMKELTISNSIKKAFISILNSERDIALSKDALAISKKELVISETKVKMGLMTEQELSNQKVTYEKNVASLAKKEKELEEAYVSLNNIMGDDVDRRYTLVLEQEYEEIELAYDMDTAITGKISRDLNIEQKKNAVKLAEEKRNLYIPGQSNLRTLENSLSSAQSSYKDAIKELGEKILACYNSAVALETEYENNLQELEVLKNKLEIVKTKYDLDLITELELQQAEYEVKVMESTIEGLIYDHMLLLDQFEHTELL